MQEHILTTALIDMALQVNDWSSAVAQLSQRLYKEKRISSIDPFIEAIGKRENIASTYCGQLIAIPHAVSEAVISPSLCIGRTTEFYWHSEDEPVQLVFMFAIPATTIKNSPAAKQIKLLTSIASLALEQKNIHCWLTARVAEEIRDSILGQLPSFPQDE